MVNRRYAIGGVLVVALLAFGLGAAFYYGVGPAPGGGGTGENIDDFPTATPSDAGTENGGSGGTAAAAPPFAFTVENIEECGRTCRDVTTTLHNNREETATGITVYIRIFAGENNTAEGDIVWEGKRDVGSIEAGGSRTSTERVDLSLNEARKIEQRGGWITILTTVESDDRTVTFQDSEQVA
ncbi:MAG: hypothetical protein ACI8U4_002489 [Natronomonas sp.]|jgi:hypothetical protein